MMDTTPRMDDEPEATTIHDYVEPSKLVHWNKLKEMIVLKGKIYKISNIGKKKLTIKIHATAPKDLADGVYTFKEIREKAGA